MAMMSKTVICILKVKFAVIRFWIVGVILEDPFRNE